MKIDRLLAITTILLNRGTVKAFELAEKFEVSTRTIYRDIDTLSAAGVPVYTSKGAGGGISLMEGYSFDKTLLSAKESESILLALQTLQATNIPEIDHIMEKFGALFQKTSVTDWVQVDFSPWGSGSSENDKFNLIRRCILKRELMQFDYVGSGGIRSKRKVEPTTLQFKSSTWYLKAWCTEKKDFRIFRLSRIHNALPAGEFFVRRINLNNTANKEENNCNVVNLRLKFKPWVEYRLYDGYKDNLIKRKEDGSLELKVSFPEDEWVYGYLLSYGPDVEVIEPPHIRKILKERMEEALKYYR